MQSHLTNFQTHLLLFLKPPRSNLEVHVANWQAIVTVNYLCRNSASHCLVASLLYIEQ